MKINENLNRLASILLAKSIIDLYPNVIIGESTITEDGFRYSFKLPTDVKISIKDFNKIKKQMQKNIDRNYEISYESLSYEQASKLFASNPYKLALLAKDQENGIIHLGNDFVDLSANLQITKFGSDNPDSKFIAIVDMARLVIDGVRIMATHYPLLAYPAEYQIFGHIHTMSDGTVHGTDGPVVNKLNKNQYDVGVDQNNYTPISYWQLCDIFRKRNNG